MAQSPIIDPKTGQPMNVDGAKAVMGDDQLRAKQAAEEIRVILEAYDAELFPVIMLSPRGVVGTSVDIIPKKRPEMPAARQADELKAVEPAKAKEAADDAPEAEKDISPPEAPDNQEAMDTVAEDVKEDD